MAMKWYFHPPISIKYSLVSYLGYPYFGVEGVIFLQPVYTQPCRLYFISQWAGYLKLNGVNSRFMLEQILQSCLSRVLKIEHWKLIPAISKQKERRYSLKVSMTQ